MRHSRFPAPLTALFFLALSPQLCFSAPDNSALSQKLDPVLVGPEVLTQKEYQLPLRGSTHPPLATVVVFLSARCPCSAAHESTLQKLFETYHSKGIQFVGIHSNTDESSQLAYQHFKRSRIRFPILEDRHAHYANQFQAYKTPHAFLVDSSGNVLFQGGIDNSTNPSRADIPFLKNAIDAVLLGKAPETPYARTLGCFIRRD